MNMEWISTAERLPEIGQPVIIAREYEKGSLRVEAAKYQENGWWKVYGTNVRKVAYWMPLPEPPEEEEKISVLRKKPGKKPERVTIENTLKALQKEVGGHIEVLTIASDCAIICNEEGKLIGLPHNCVVCSQELVGTILIVGIKGEEFASVTENTESNLQKLFQRLWK